MTTCPHGQLARQCPICGFAEEIAELKADRDRLAAENARLRTVAEEIVYLHGYYSDASDSAYRRALRDSIDELGAMLGEEGK